MLPALSLNPSSRTMDMTSLILGTWLFTTSLSTGSDQAYIVWFWALPGFFDPSLSGFAEAMAGYRVRARFMWHKSREGPEMVSLLEL